MGLYDDRLAHLSEARRSRGSSTSRPSMEIQSLLFHRDAGWTVEKAKVWAKEHGYKRGDVDVTEQYIRLRQFSPKGLKVKRTITLGRGIRAVVAREGEKGMATAEARRRTKRTTTKTARKKRTARHKRSHRATEARRKAPARRKRRVAAAAETPRRRKRRTTRAAESPRRRRKAPAKRRRTTARAAEAPRRRRRRRSHASESWYGESRRHSKAAKKGHRRRKRRVSEAPRRRTHRRRHMSEARRGTKKGMQMGEFALALLTGGLGFVLADGVDRLLATYNPSATTAPAKDKFTSDGSGTLANTLNIASAPGLARLGAGVGLTALPAIASRYVSNPFARSAFEGWAIGSGVNLFKTMWNNLVMPLLVGKDTSTAALQKSYVARLYPAEVAATLNRKQSMQTVSSAGGAGALSGAADVGPYALAGDSSYPDAAEALRQETGTAGPGGDYPTVQQELGTGGNYPTATQAMNGNVGAGWEPGPPSLPGPGPQPEESCGCSDNLGFIGDEPDPDSPAMFGAVR